MADFQDEEEIDDFVDRFSNIMTARYDRLPSHHAAQSNRQSTGGEGGKRKEGEEVQLDVDTLLLPSSYLMWEYCPETISTLLAVLLEGQVKVVLMSSLYASGGGGEDASQQEEEKGQGQKGKKEGGALSTSTASSSGDDGLTPKVKRTTYSEQSDEDDEDDEDDDASDDDASDEDEDEDEDDEDSEGSDSGSSSEEEEEVCVDAASLLALYDGIPGLDCNTATTATTATTDSAAERVAVFRHLSQPPGQHQHPEEVQKIEPHFGTPFFLLLLKHEHFQVLTRADPSSSQMQTPTQTQTQPQTQQQALYGLHLPVPNPYVPYSLALLPAHPLRDQMEHTSNSPAVDSATGSDKRELQVEKKFPQLVYENVNDTIAIWHLLDTQFHLPKVWYHVKFTAAFPVLTLPREEQRREEVDERGERFTEEYVDLVVLNDLFSCVLEDALTETCYAASLAHLKVGMAGLMQ